MLTNLIKLAAVLIAAGILGSSFMAEARKSKLRGDPWYRPYLTLPGLLVCLAILLPLVAWWLKIR